MSTAESAEGEAGFSRMFSEHSRRRTGATDFVAPWAAAMKNHEINRNLSAISAVKFLISENP
jgi:hypothetical protein